MEHTRKQKKKGKLREKISMQELTHMKANNSFSENKSGDEEKFLQN